SSLRTWERKPQMVVAGVKTRSQYVTPCSSRASRMRGSVRTSANGRPSWRAKRARSCSRLILDSAWAIRGGTLEFNSGGSICGVIIPAITTVYRLMFTLRFKASAIRRIDRSIGEPPCARRCRRTEACNAALGSQARAETPTENEFCSLVQHCAFCRILDPQGRGRARPHPRPRRPCGSKILQDTRLLRRVFTPRLLEQLVQGRVDGLMAGTARPLVADHPPRIEDIERRCVRQVPSGRDGPLSGVAQIGERPPGQVFLLHHVLEVLG